MIADPIAHMVKQAMAAEIERLDRAKGSAHECTWTFDDQETYSYETSCGEAFTITEGTPADNKMKYCCYCGGTLVDSAGHASTILKQEEKC